MKIYELGRDERFRRMTADIYISKTPTRLDYCGGTLDIYPLYILHGGVKLISTSIDIMTEAKIEQDKSLDHPHLISKDLGVSQVLTENEIQPELSYHQAIIDYFELDNDPIRLITSSHAPFGSGLGASSSLLVAMAKVAAKYSNLEMTDAEILQIAQDIETAHLKVPTGTQDYLAALNDGMRVIHYQPGEIKIEPVSVKFRSDLAKHTYVIYTGQSHSSARENWMMFKNRIDQGDTSDISKKFEELKKIADEMYNAISTENVEEFISLINQEWNLRKSLIPSMETKKMKLIIDKLLEYGLIHSAKACGAGGGGTLMVFGDEDLDGRIEDIIQPYKASLLKCNPYFDDN